MDDKVSVCIRTVEIDGEDVPLRDEVAFAEGKLHPDEVLLVNRPQAQLMQRRGVVDIIEPAQVAAEHPAKKTAKKKPVSKKAPATSSVLD